MKRILFLLTALLLLPLPARAATLTLSAESALLMEKTTGEILYAQNEREQLPPASVTKVMTLLLVMEAIDRGELALSDTVTASAYACSMGGSQVYLKEGEQMSVEDLLKAVCVASGNDASVALGEHIAGSADAFVERMNERARELGMSDTHFVNCTGLPAEGHLTSARDIAIMSRELILKHPSIRNYTTIWMDSLRGGAFGLSNTNKLIRFYEGATGLKTGSTDAAKYCISATAERDGMELIAVVLKGPTSQQRFDDAKVLLNYGFAAYALQTVTPEVPLPTLPVTLGACSEVSIEPPSRSVLLKKSDLPNLRQELSLPESVSAPVEQGEQLGTLSLYAGDTLLTEIPLTAAEGVELLTWKTMLTRLWRFGLYAPLS